MTKLFRGSQKNLAQDILTNGEKPTEKFHLDLSFLKNSEKTILMMSPPTTEKLMPLKRSILLSRKHNNESLLTIQKVESEINNIIIQRGKGYPKRMKKPPRRDV